MGTGFSVARFSFAVLSSVVLSILSAFALGFCIGMTSVSRTYGPADHGIEFSWFLGEITAFGAAVFIVPSGIFLMAPLHFFAIRLKRFRARDYLLAGMAAGMAELVLVHAIGWTGLVDFSIPPQMSTVAAIAAPLLGAISGISFWAVVRPDKTVAQ